MDLSVSGSSISKRLPAINEIPSQRPKPLTIDREAVLGKGAYGKVYKGMLHTDQRKKAVAIKQMSYSPPSTNGIPLAALREIAATSHLADSKHIISLLDHRTIQTDHENTKLVLVYELMTCDLTKFLKDFRNEHGYNQQLPMNLIQKWSQQLMSGVEEMHTNRIIHRDLKPDNILIDSHTMNLKISDLGLAHVHGFEGSRTPEVVTLWYRSPEIVMRLPYGSSCDIWSIGLIMYEMIRLKPLIVGEGEIELIRNILKVTGKPSDSYLSGINVRSWECFVKPEDLPLVNRIPEQLAGEEAALVDLFERLLRFEGDDRLTAYEALQHPFFQPDYLGSSQGSDSSVASENSMETESRISAVSEEFMVAQEVANEEEFPMEEEINEEDEEEEEQEEVEEEGEEEEEEEEEEDEEGEGEGEEEDGDETEDEDADGEEEEDEEDLAILNVDHQYLPSFRPTSRQQKRRRTVGPCEVSSMDTTPPWVPLKAVDQRTGESGWSTDSSSSSEEQPLQVLVLDSKRLVLRQSYDAYRPEEINAIVNEFSARNPNASRLWSEQEPRRRGDGWGRRSLVYDSVWTRPRADPSSRLQ